MSVDIGIVQTDYRRYILRKVIFIVGCIVAMVLVLGYAATIGTSGITAWEVYRDIFYHFVDPSKCDPEVDWVVFTVRLPRIMTGLIAGMSLGIAGAAMQSMMKNPLADPYTTGISSGASFGATLAIVLGFNLAGLGGTAGLIVTAFFFGSITSCVETVLRRNVSMTCRCP